MGGEALFSMCNLNIFTLNLAHILAQLIDGDKRRIIGLLDDIFYPDGQPSHFDVEGQ